MTASGTAADVGRYLETDDRKTLLRFITCGSVDDGKSTLIGRLLYESKLIFDDQLAALEADSRRVGTQGGALDFALLVDGLAAEREQGITIDVAYRFFTTERRKFIVADTPGHEQYTRNMATGASTADVAVILVDARKGVLTQTRRHSFIVAMLGIKRVALAVNKMDLVGYDQAVFDRIAADYREFAVGLGLTGIEAIPISALRGDNVVEPGPAMPWYDGPPLLSYLESVEAGSDAAGGPFRLPVQLVTRPDLDFRGYAGIIAGGSVRPGDEVRVLPSGATATVLRIVTFDGDLPVAETGQSVTLTLDREIDVSRGDLIVAAAEPAGVADQFEAHLVWMHTEPLLPGRPYLMKLASSTAACSVTHIKHGINVNTLERTPASTLSVNDIAVANIATDRRLPFDPYAVNRDTGGFVLIDRLTNVTVGAGMIDFALRRSDNIHWQALDVTREARAAIKGHRPGVVWFTGISGAGKSTIANALEGRLHALGCHTATLDGDNVRHRLNRDLGFTDADRVENIRRVGEVARLMADAGLLVLVSFISPFRAERDAARALVGAGEFVEVFVDTPLDVAEGRDRKGLYRKARAGSLPHFTGIDSPYEPPPSPEVRIDTVTSDVPESVEQIVSHLREKGIVP
ncbi:sulfate adenylyltransferase subunit CysN [Trebonia kvetii]|uniref:Multifunctional fusion protein n=1 Tax=Trebonia kvetii TaxID=2480626 RepID=A0A6P2BTS7_9ACTN|nr:sulfate adenylyltransferase subunit CysN [Trebonia kvetii]TVZ02390.1 sulfate adenylyltransferase subunit CysN [Trebonia kvetii]